MVSSLDRKLRRDLWRMKGQALAIGLVISLGVLMLVMMDGLVNTLEETRQAYYERYRLADVFIPVKRAPNDVLRILSEIKGVSAVESRVKGDALIDLPEVSIPLRAQAVSLPDAGTPQLNDVVVTAGRMLDASRANEILLLESFANARQLTMGDKLTATMNGIRHTFNIVGLAQSPEFLYTTAPGELVPDDGRFAVFWMSQSALGAAYDVEGAFNEALLSLTRDARLSSILDQVDRIVAPYGGIGAYGLEDQTSNRFVTEEISGLRASAVGVPPIFVGVAAFLLYIVVSRMVQSEREQIGLLKAFGYSSWEISSHYLKLVIVIAAGGAIAGSLMGIAAGSNLALFYQTYFKFPFIVFKVDPKAFIIGFTVSILSASLGGLLVLRKIFKLTPAVAMRPAAPSDYSQSGQFLKRIKHIFDQPSRMVLRRVLRQPGRMLGAVTGIATGMSLSVAMLAVLNGFDTTIELTFSVVDRSDAAIVFTHPVSDKVVFELESLTGVTYVEPFRNVPVMLRNGRSSHRGYINGLTNKPTLYRALDAGHNTMPLDQNGIVIAKPLANILNISQGDFLTVEVREGRRPVLIIPVTGVAETLLGSPTYMDITWLNRYLKEPQRVSGVYLILDELHSEEVYKTIKKLPAVAGMTLKNDSAAAFAKLMDSGAGAMRYIMAMIAGVITFGIVYNAARIAYAERERDLASLRVIGFTKAETAYVLLGELALITLVALPVGGVLGYYLSKGISQGFSTDIYQIPATFSLESYGAAGISVLIAAFASGWLVKRDIDRLDLVTALKSKE
ncbi:ABC transporter permease [Alteromonas genovensis]|uniref:ABC transporter permease n=1 Tax=Alteromonas genovensis TaxID=471225 RepID=UPI002FE2DC2C